jgi:FlaA1/EpsC-like NDP-sugar epimerase
LLGYGPKRVIALDNNETGLFDLAQALRFHKHASCFHPYIGDITDVQSMQRFFAVEHPHVVFHAAAYKHVPLLEQHPEQAIRTNAIATYRLCRLAQDHEVKRFVFVSTDKAAEPTSVLGASKRFGEMVVQSLAKTTNSKTRFCAVRFGNVIGSRGSVVPVFTQQIQQGGPVTVTDPEATRYFMTIPEACGLVILTVTMADQGELYLLDMGEPIRIVDIAIKMIHAHGLRLGHDISIVYTGLRPGEKLHETLVTEREELYETAHNKIFSIASHNTISTAPLISQWIHILENSLQSESCSQLRERLFEFVREQELMVAK